MNYLRSFRPKEGAVQDDPIMIAHREVGEALRHLKEGKGEPTSVGGIGLIPLVTVRVHPLSRIDQHTAVRRADACVEAARDQLSSDKLYLAVGYMERWLRQPSKQRFDRPYFLSTAHWLLGWHRLNPRYLAGRISARVAT